MEKVKTLVCIVGPTAVGKTATAISVAGHFKSEIISADSRQVFQELSIGTAKPTLEELAQVTHHFVDFLPLETEYSSGQFEKDVIPFLEDYFVENDICVCAGGSGLYVNALLFGLDDLPSSLAVRDDLKEKLKEKGIGYLQQELKLLDPEHYKKMDVQNTQRLIRALEVCLVSGKKYSELRTTSQKKRPFKTILIGLNREREELYNRINLRVDSMLEDGLLEEVKSVAHKKDINALQTVGYREFFPFLEGEYDLEEAIRLVKRNTRRFAKRQLTWFKRYEGIDWFHPNDVVKINEYIASKVIS